eukprot:775934-Amphidinium_carterae.1
MVETKKCIALPLYHTVHTVTNHTFFLIGVGPLCFARVLVAGLGLTLRHSDSRSVAPGPAGGRAHAG